MTSAYLCDPSQSVKPGSRMPPQEMSAAELQDLLAYLETLR